MRKFATFCAVFSISRKDYGADLHRTAGSGGSKSLRNHQAVFVGATSGAAVLLDLTARAQACCHKFVTASRNFVPASCSVWDFADSASRALRYFAIHSCSESHCLGGVAMA